MKRALPYTVFLVAAALGATFASCGQYESCDPGMVLQFNICLPGVTDGGPADGAGGGMCNPPPPIPDGGEGFCADPAAGFGETCSRDEHCRCGKDLCAVIPGQTCGFCTRHSCLQDPSICPPGWTCYDASSFQPGYSLCVQM